MLVIAKTKIALKGTEIHAETGMIKDVGEKEVVHTYAKTQMNKENKTEKKVINEKEVPVEDVAENKVSTEGTVDTVVTKMAEKEVKAEDPTGSTDSEEGIKSGATEVSLKAAVTMTTKWNKALKCQGRSLALGGTVLAHSSQSGARSSFDIC